MKAFIVHAWNNEKASLYHPICDGIEYIQSVISTIKKSFEKSGIEIKYDANSFRADDTIRRNFQKQIKDAQLIVVLLDGLRPNVVYEMGYAAALENKKILCLSEKNATILVRNFYPEPLAVPATNGLKYTILNPKLDVYSALSDCSDLFILKYDRFDMDDLKEQLKAYLDEYAIQTPKEKQIQTTIQKQDSEFSDEINEENSENSENTNSSQSASSTDSCESRLNDSTHLNSDEIYPRKYIWDLFVNGKDDEIQKIDNSRLDPYSKKTKALSFFRQKKISDAIDAFKLLFNEKESLRYSAYYFLGVCYLFQRKYFEAFTYLLNAKINGYTPKASTIDELIDLFAEEINFKDWKKLFPSGDR